MAAEADKLNWRVAALVTVVGLGVIGAGLWLGDFTAATFSGLLIEIGGGIGLLVVLLLLERRLVGAVKSTAASVARTTAREETQSLSDRVLRLEDLDDAQVSARAADRERQTEELERFHRSGLTVETVGALLKTGDEERLFEPGTQPRVRTGPSTDCHVLYMVGFADPKRVWCIYMDFDWINFDSQPMMVEGSPFPVPYKTETMALWTADDDAASIALELEKGLRRANKPLRGFSLGYALDQLVSAVEIMRRARSADDDSPQRLQGALRMLVNKSWVLTDRGLEAVASPECYAIVTDFGSDRRWAGIPSSRPIAALGHTSTRFVAVSPDRRDDLDPDWLDAVKWMTDVERVEVRYAEAEMPT